MADVTKLNEKTVAWEKNLEKLKNGEFGDESNFETLARYWKAQSEADYPGAIQNYLYFKTQSKGEDANKKDYHISGEYGMQFRVAPPKILEENEITKIVDTVATATIEDVDNALYSEIVKNFKDKGASVAFIFDKKELAKALSRHQATKPRFVDCKAFCPCCGELLILGRKQYCYECGQKLDWGT